MASIRVIALAGLAVAFFVLGKAAAAAPGGAESEVTFTDTTPLSSNAELARRMLSPLNAARIPGMLARAGKALSEQPIDLAAERFVVYAPAKAPAGGYGLLVFVPPWEEAKLPAAWAPVLDQLGVIFVSAARSGNADTDLGRREPLALLAARNVIARYHVDPDRVWVGGFSGGSRVAMRLALAYPDLFRGALLVAGSDPIGDAQAPLPPRDLLQQFQSASRLVYVTGEHDTDNLTADAVSQRSMRQWCAFDLKTETAPRIGHELIGGETLAKALAALAGPPRPDAGKLAACRAAIETELTVKLAQAQSLITAGKTGEARRSLSAVDARFGGLAAPRSLELERQLGGP